MLFRSGPVPWLEAPTKKIELTNLSRHDIFLRNPHFTCSCFAFLTQVPPAVHPGQTVDFVVRMWTRMGEPGRFHKKLIIETDDAKLGTLEIPMIGSITDFRTVTPNQLVLGKIEPGDEPVEKTIEVRGGAGFVVHVAEAKVADARLVTEVKPVEGGADVIVRTVAKPEKGWISAQVLLGVDVGAAGGPTRRYTETVRVSGEVR